MKVSAGWIHAKRPSRSTVLLPGGQPERVAKQVADRARSQQGRRDRVTAERAERQVRWCVRPPTGLRIWNDRELARAGVGTKRRRLRGPIQIAKRARERVEVVLRAVVIATNGLQAVQVIGSSSVRT
jgi:transposase